VNAKPSICYGYGLPCVRHGAGKARVPPTGSMALLAENGGTPADD
jgi:hypothetical protein